MDPSARTAAGHDCQLCGQGAGLGGTAAGRRGQSEPLSLWLLRAPLGTQKKLKTLHPAPPQAERPDLDKQRNDLVVKVANGKRTQVRVVYMVLGFIWFWGLYGFRVYMVLGFIWF